MHCMDNVLISYNFCKNYMLIELIISPSALSLSSVSINNIPVISLNLSGTVRVNFSISVCSNMSSLVIFTETLACEAPGVNKAVSLSEAKSTPPPTAPAMKGITD